MAEYFIIFLYICIYTYLTFSLSTHPSMDTGCFHILAFASNAAMNVGHRYLFETLISFPLDTYPEVGLLGHMVGLFLIF